MTTNGRASTNGRPITPAARNVLGGPLAIWGTDPLTGFYRTGCCDTGPDDLGVHVVCAQVTAEFLAFSRSHRASRLLPGLAGRHAPGGRRGLRPPWTPEEWQRHADGTVTGRLSTVVFRDQPDTPNGLAWVRVHETWLPEALQ